MDFSLFIGVVLAIALWGLIGTERELPWAGSKIGWATWFWGIRTYASIAFFGALCTWLDIYFSTKIWILVGAIISAVFILVSYIYSSFRRDKMGATSEYAGLITYFIGVMTMLSQYTYAVIFTILLLLLLSAKEYFAKIKNHFSRQEFWDSLKFWVIALVILPLLPDMKYSLVDMSNWFASGGLSWTHPILLAKFFNPYSIWMFVVVMAGVEYAGFLLGKALGDKGWILASGAVGGLISSTATTFAMTRKSKEHPVHRNSYAVATLLASCIMFIRVIVVAAYIYPLILTSILIPGGVMFIALMWAMIYYFFLSRHEKIPVVEEEKKWAYESPFQLLPALQFAGLIIFIKFLSAAWVASQSLISPEYKERFILFINYTIGLLSWFADVDAVNFTMSEWAKDGSIPIFVAATTILIAVMSNNTVKASIAYRFGEKEYGRKVLTGFSISIILWILTIIGLSFFA